MMLNTLNGLYLGTSILSFGRRMAGKKGGTCVARFTASTFDAEPPRNGAVPFLEDE
jgi:hypothetical protein